MNRVSPLFIGMTPTGGYPSKVPFGLEKGEGLLPHPGRIYWPELLSGVA
jgi:hypothetical protein